MGDAQPTHQTASAAVRIHPSSRQVPLQRAGKMSISVILHRGHVGPTPRPPGIRARAARHRAENSLCWAWWRTFTSRSVTANRCARQRRARVGSLAYATATLGPAPPAGPPGTNCRSAMKEPTPPSREEGFHARAPRQQRVPDRHFRLQPSSVQLLGKKGPASPADTRQSSSPWPGGSWLTVIGPPGWPHGGALHQEQHHSMEEPL